MEMKIAESIRQEMLTDTCRESVSVNGPKATATVLAISNLCTFLKNYMRNDPEALNAALTMIDNLLDGLPDSLIEDLEKCKIWIENRLTEREQSYIKSMKQVNDILYKG